MDKDKVEVNSRFFSHEIIKNWGSIKSLYDLVAFCYMVLEQTVNNQIIFMGQYVNESNDSKRNNPNINNLRLFSNVIKAIIKEDFIIEFGKDFFNSRIISSIEEMENKLIPFQDDLINQMTIPFYVLLGVDRFLEDSHNISDQSSPLNRYLREKYCVYATSKTSLGDAIIHKNNYPSRILPNDVRNYFSCFILIKKSELKGNIGFPRLVNLFKERELLKNIIDNKKVKIAVFPCGQSNWFKFKHDVGAGFVVEYDENMREAVTKKILRYIEIAIRSEVNIIVLPEYICSEKIQAEISIFLKNLAKRNLELMDHLLLVVVGSAWTKDSNNVCVLMSYNGYVIGKVYKESAYDKKINEEIYIENLKNPGKEITLVRIPDFGIIQVAICRDVSDGTLCNQLADLFVPQFLLVPAWSKSVNRAFKPQIEKIIMDNHKTCAVICNSCEAIEGTKEEVGIISVPKQENHNIEADTKYIMRDTNYCCVEGHNCCWYEIEYDFNEKVRKNVYVNIKNLKM